MSNCRNQIFLRFWEEQNSFMSICSSFQYNNVKLWNSDIKNESKILIPPVSLRDEIKTEVFGMAIIELLLRCGILVARKVSREFTTYELSTN